MVDRCVCYDVSFETLLESAKRHQCKTLVELQAHVEFGQRCRLCHPYVERMLETGETEFEVMPVAY